MAQQTIPMQPPGSHMVTIYHAKTGAAIERWPVDARGMVECGEYTLTPPSGGADAAPDAPAVSEQEPCVAPGAPLRAHPLSTPEVAVPVVLGAATEARPVTMPAPGVKRGPGRPRKFPTE